MPEGTRTDVDAMLEALSIEAFLDARLPPGDGGYLGWTRAAAAAACAGSGGIDPPAELRQLLRRWVEAPTTETRRALVRHVPGATLAVTASAKGSTPAELAAAAITGMGGGFRIDAELALGGARAACASERELRTLAERIAEALASPGGGEPLAPPAPTSPRSIPPVGRLPPGWRPGGGFDAELGRPRQGVSAPRAWRPELGALDALGDALAAAWGARVLEASVERSRSRAYVAMLRLELASADHVRVMLERDARGASEVSVVVFGDGAEVLFADLCGGLDRALEETARGSARTSASRRPSFARRAGDAAQTLTSVLRGRPILPAGYRWVGDQATSDSALPPTLLGLERLAEVLERELGAVGEITIRVRGRGDRRRIELVIAGDALATIDGHGSELHVRAPSHATVAAVARAIDLARTESEAL